MKNLNMKALKHLLILLSFFVSGSLVMAQTADECSKTGPDELKSKKEYSLYREFIKQKAYDDAIVHWRYVYKFAPGLRKTTFVDGVKMYKHFIDNSEDSTQRLQLIDTLMQVYSNRIRCHGEKGFVVGRAAYDLYRYTPQRTDTIRGLIAQSIELRGNETEYFLLQPYFQLVVLAWSRDKIDDDSLLVTFDQLMAIAEANSQNMEMDEKKRDRWTKTYSAIEQMLPSSVLTCENLVARIEKNRDKIFSDLSEMKKNYNNLKLAKDSAGNRCTDNALYCELILAIYEQDQSPIIAEEAGGCLYRDGKKAEAIELFDQAIELETDPLKQADIAMTIAKIYRNDNQFSIARKYARKAIAFNPKWGDPYILIGDMYASSGKICGGMDGELSALPALDKYAQAKRVDPEAAETAQARINKYSNYMPTITYLFERGMNEGDSYTFGCWIGETTTLRAKKSN